METEARGSKEPLLSTPMQSYMTGVKGKDFDKVVGDVAWKLDEICKKVSAIEYRLQRRSNMPEQALTTLKTDKAQLRTSAELLTVLRSGAANVYEKVSNYFGSLREMTDEESPLLMCAAVLGRTMKVQALHLSRYSRWDTLMVELQVDEEKMPVPEVTDLQCARLDIVDTVLVRLLQDGHAWLSVTMKQ